MVIGAAGGRQIPTSTVQGIYEYSWSPGLGLGLAGNLYSVANCHASRKLGK